MELKQRSVLDSIACWFDAHAGTASTDDDAPARRFDWARLAPFVGLHLGCIAVLWGAAGVQRGPSRWAFGEGWHNNHHHFPGAARQGFYWWEIDLTYYGLRVLAWLGVIWDLKEPPVALLAARRVSRGAA